MQPLENGAIIALLAKADRLCKELYFVAAADAYEQVIKLRPNNCAALTGLSYICLINDNFDGALTLSTRSIEIEPLQPLALYNQGSALLSLGRASEAISSFENALKINASYFEAHVSRAIALRALNRFDGAIESYKRALELRPGDATALNGMGNVLRIVGRLNAALTCYEGALIARPDYAKAHHNRGSVLASLDRVGEALASFMRAILHEPKYVDAYISRAHLLFHCGDAAGAVADFSMAIELGADTAEIYYGRGLAFYEMSLIEDAEGDFRRAVSLQPDFAAAYNNLGVVQKELQRLDQAMKSYDLSISLDPINPSPAFNKALCQLLAGNYVEGWAGYEKRLELPTANPSNSALPGIRWSGAQCLENKTILLYAEQGLGDTIQFCRYIPMVTALGAKIILQVQWPLRRLLSTLAGVVYALGPDDIPPPCDFHCPIMSLPLAFRTHPAMMPRKVKYLDVDSKTREFWRFRLQTLNGLKVGLIWAAGTRPALDRGAKVLNERRSIPLGVLAPILSLPGVSFISLQKGIPSQEAFFLREHFEIYDHMALASDLLDTAGIIDNLDLVISVDTSVAHLAGALGKAVWLLNRFDTDWRWSLHTEDSVWYPSMRQFRQPNAGEWLPVVLQVRSALSSEIEKLKNKSLS